jgi:uncharacterized RDD family membrane protein YckC
MLHSQENDNTVYAGFFVRLTAYLIDSLLIGTVLLLVRVPMFFVRMGNPELFLLKPLLFRFSLYDIIMYLAACAYFILLTYYTGSTVGKRLMNLKVVSGDGTPLTLLNVLYRETIGRYLSSILFIGYIMIGASSEKRGLHDFLCNTRVIYTCKCIPVAAAYRPIPGYGTTYGFGQSPRAAETPAEPHKCEISAENPADAVPQEADQPAQSPTDNSEESNREQ